jgi:hypothetical protein
MTELITCLSFQSQRVSYITLRDGVYKADATKCRERRDYYKDIEQLGGENPIWCFAPRTDRVGEDFEAFVKSEDFWIMASNQMSLARPSRLAAFSVLELRLSEERLKWGLTHNACAYSYVFSCLYREDIRAVYQLSYGLHWGSPVILPVYIKAGCLFPKITYMDTNQMSY